MTVIYVPLPPNILLLLPPNCELLELAGKLLLLLLTVFGLTLVPGGDCRTELLDLPGLNMLPLTV